MADDSPTPVRTAPLLTGAQRQLLRSRAHGLDPVVQVGQAGVTAAILRAVDDALLAHELIKVRLHRPEDKQAAANELATGSASALCGLIGHTVILYRPHPEPKIALA